MSLTSRVLAGFGPEDREHRLVILHCEANDIPVFHVPNSTFTRSPMVKVRNNLLGVRRGIPDLFALPGGHLVSIEMKSATGTATKEQKEWLERLNAAGIPSIVAKTAEPAIEFLDHYAANPKPPGEAITTASYIETPEIITDAGKRYKLKPTDDKSPF